MISNLSITPLGFGAWVLSWTGDAGDTFRVYRDGVQIAQTSGTSLTVAVDEGTFPVFEVLEAGAAPSKAFPGYMVLAWYRPGPGIARYAIEQYDGSAWKQVGRIDVTDSDQTYFKWTSGWLDDSQEHQFRITPATGGGVEGTPVVRRMLMVRRPDPPDANFEYDPGTGDVTVSLN